VEKRGGKRARPKEKSREIESNAETQRALRIRREEKGLTQRARRTEHRDHGEFGGRKNFGRFGDLREELEIARVIYSAAKIVYWSCLLG
jgi:hypothetical protein